MTQTDSPTPEEERMPVGLAEPEPEPEPDPPEQDDDEAPPAAIVERARKMGWKDEDEYSGDPDSFVPADEFVRRGEEELPILRERFRKLDTKFDQITAQNRELSETMKKLVTGQAARQRQAVDRAVGDLRAQRRAAIEDGDADRVEALDQEIEAARSEAPPEEAADDNETKAEPPPELKDWYDRNKSWFDANPDMRAMAIAIYDTTGGGVTDRLRAADQALRQRFPEKFRAREPRRSPVEPSNPPKGADAAHRWEELPEEEQDVGANLIKQGVFKNRQEVIDAYFKE